MKITKSQLRQIIKEEISKSAIESHPDFPQAKGLYETLVTALYGEEAKGEWNEILDEWLEELRTGVQNLIFRGQKLDDPPSVETRNFVQFAATVLEAAHEPWRVERAKTHTNMKKFYERMESVLKHKESETRSREAAAEWQLLVDRWHNLKRGNFQPHRWPAVGDASAHYKAHRPQFLQEIRKSKSK